MSFLTASNRTKGRSEGFRVRWNQASNCALTPARSPKEVRTRLSSRERHPAIQPATTPVRQGLSLKMLVSLAAMLALLPLATCPLSAGGLSDGSIGATSRGTVQISVSVAPRITIGRIAVAGAAVAGVRERLCLSSNDSGAVSVRIFAEAGGADGAPLPVFLAMPGEVGSVAGADRTLSLGTAGPLAATSSEALGACNSKGLIVRGANLRGNLGGALLLLIAPD